MTDKTLTEQITTALQTVYDPDFPLVDIYTLGLIYEGNLDKGCNVIYDTSMSDGRLFDRKCKKCDTFGSSRLGSFC